MPSVAVTPPRTPVTKGSNGIAAATIPNVCKMPGPPAPFVPAPLPNVGRSATSPKGYTKKVKVEGQIVAISGAYFKSVGDIASKGTGGGIVSASTHGKTKFVAPGAITVKFEGKRVQLLGDAMTNNSGSPPNSATLPGEVQGAAGVLPVLEFDKALFPEKIGTIKAGMAKNNCSGSMKLTRQTDRKKIRHKRYEATKRETKAKKGFSLDEFPFASACEGGPGKTEVRPIPVKEQSRQGGTMASFYRANDIGNGQPFIVRIT